MSDCPQLNICMPDIPVLNLSACSNTVVSVSGSAPINPVILSGVGGTTVFLSGGYVLISGGAGQAGTTGDLGSYVLKTTQVNGHQLTGDVTVIAADIPVGIVPGAGYTNLQQFINVMHSPGLIAGAVITDGGSGFANISAGTGMLRVADDDISSLLFVNIPAASIAVPFDGNQYNAGFVYNTGDPRFELRLSPNWDNDTEIPLGTIYNFYNTLVISNNPFKVGDPITNIIQRFDAMSPITRDETVGGIAIGEGASRTITVSPGKLWTRLNSYTVPTLDTAVATTMYSAYFNGAQWVYTTPITQWDNTSYNDITMGLVPVDLGYFSNLWFYLTVESNSLGFVYDQSQYGDLTSASLASPPSFLPPNFTQGSILIGRLLFHNGATSADQLDSAFSTTFTSSPVTSHNNLAGLQGGAAGQFYHLSANDYTSLTGQAGRPMVNTVNGLSGVLNVTGAGSVNVTVDGQTLIVSGSAQEGDFITTGQTGQFASAFSLGQTGQVLDAKIAALSGHVDNVSGALQAQITHGTGTQVSVTGSLPLPTANLTGQGGLVVYTVGSTVFFSGGAGAGTVTQAQFDALSGNLGLSGANLYALIVNASGQLTTDLATKTQLTQSGVALGAQVASLSGFTTAQLVATGNSAVIHANGIGSGLSGNLAATGSYLYGQNTGLSGYLISLINAASAGVSALNGASGVLNLIGTGGLVVLTQGQTIIVSGNLDPANFPTTAMVTGMSGALVNTIIATGNAAVSHANGGLVITSGNLTQTGIDLMARDVAISGVLETRIAATGQAGLLAMSGASGVLQAQISALPTASQLALTGSQLYQIITGQSGQAVLDYATKTQLTQSGVNIGVSLISLSGFTTGVSGFLQNEINALPTAAQLALTGSQLFVTLTGLSGAFDTKIIATGASLLAHINGGLSIVSGNATQSGIQLLARDLLVSGWLTTGLAQTGSAAVNHANGGLSIISGNLTTTGITLYALLTGGSGQGVIDYATKTNLALTGANLLAIVTGLSGATNTLVIASGASAVTHANGIGINLSGQITNLSGFVLANTGGVSSANGLSGAVSVVGAGGFSVTTNNQQIIISGASTTIINSGTVNITYNASGQLDFVTGLATGSDTYFIGFNPPFETLPNVQLTQELQYSNNIYPFAIRSRTTSGVNILLGETLADTGLFFNVKASTVTGGTFISGTNYLNGVNTYNVSFTTSSGDIETLARATSSIDITLSNLRPAARFYVTPVSDSTVVNFIPDTGMTIVGSTSMVGDGSIATLIQLTSSVWQVFSPTPNTKTLFNNLVSFWPLDETLGTTRRDAFGASPVSAVATQQCGVGKTRSAALLLSGVANQELLTPVSEANFKFNPGNSSFTLGGWIKMTNWASPVVMGMYDGAAVKRCYTLQGSSGISGFVFQFSPSGANSLIQSISVSGVANTGTWYHVLGHFNASTQKIGISFNGARSETTTSGFSPFVTSNIGLGIGTSSTGTITTKALLQDMGYWSRDLTTGEAGLLYNGGAGLTYPFNT